MSSYNLHNNLSHNNTENYIVPIELLNNIMINSLMKIKICLVLKLLYFVSCNCIFFKLERMKALIYHIIIKNKYHNIN